VARKTEIINVTSEGRDKGKQFIITEMPALRAERWAFRALLALAHSGVELPAGAADGGMAVLASAGLQALNSLDFEEARPLLDEMWSCVQIVPDPKNPNIVRPLVIREADGDDIEELPTIFQLRERIFRLHTDFFFKGK
jgi:hypothetical protein